ncbi:hypothetical protein Poli38472_012237 [Pythium oligandrum]|uniref:THH1/TOM1/TOM3 domain-containing protein n=1 Tax=Pythium oligandrum TaxID=41045 RepID=A0A8K1CR28_PYTOL|nr:hypothetical protein Poli38472_012237 [Pythium oligandrum]|eukprot:TMW67121.1 hypothetical protein Poli38472_012237 [Pythium oligandrum]
MGVDAPFAASLRAQDAAMSLLYGPAVSAKPSDRDDGLVFLPQPSPFVGGVCVLLYLVLGLVALVRTLQMPKAPHRRRPDQLKRHQAFQRLLVVFAFVRSLSFLTLGLTRDVLNRLALCLFFSLVLLEVLFWIDIANPKRSTRSRRIWNAFLVANGLFYVVVIGLSALHLRSPPTVATDTDDQTPFEVFIARARDWDLIPVLLIALGSLASSLGLLYSTCKTRRRVGRVLQEAAIERLPARFNQRVETKLQRALSVTNVIMGICSALFLLRTIFYVQRPFSHRECGAIEDADTCILVGYGLTELVPCVLFLVLMWEVEPHLDLPSRRRSSLNVFAVARATETTPLLRERQRPPVLNTTLQESTSSSVYSRSLRSQRPSPLSSAVGGRGGSVIEEARRRLKRVLEESFGLRSEEESSRSYAYSDSLALEQSRVSSSHSHNELSSTFMWMSFQCFNLTLPSTSAVAVFLVLHRVSPDSKSPDGVESTEIGRTEVAYSKDPCFHILVPVEVEASGTLRATAYAVLNPSAMDDLDTQWLIGDALLPLSAYVSTNEHGEYGAVIPGTASVHEFFSPLSRTHSPGQLVARCEADIWKESSVLDRELYQHVTRAFVYVPSATTDSSNTPPRTKLLVEEELVESVYTWEIPYQLLQLIHADLLVQLDALKREIVDDNTSSTAPEPNRPVETVAYSYSDAKLKRSESLKAQEVSTRSRSAPSIGMLSEMILHIQDDALKRKNQRWRRELTHKMEEYIQEVETAILRYERAAQDGLTFKPSTMKANAGLSFVAVNLHQQLLTVGRGVPSDPRDIRQDEKTQDGQHYMRLMNTSFVETPVLPPHTTGSESPETEDEEGDDVVVPAPAPGPYEALRRRVISFDSAEQIVQLMNASDTNSGGLTLSREQCQLAESIVALGIDGIAFDSDVRAEIEAEEEPPVPGDRANSTTTATHDQAKPSNDESAQPSSVRSTPYCERSMYATTTVGAFAAHTYKFRKGGTRQMRAKLERIRRRLSKEAERPGSDLTVEGLEREYLELKWHIDRRLEVAFCQAMSALVTCFQQTLYVHLYEQQATEAMQVSQGLTYLEQLADVGFLFSVESLLSTYSKEAGMLGDMEAAVHELERVRIKFRPVATPRAAQFRVSVTSGQDGLVMELPLITCSPMSHRARSMHRVPGQDATTGAVYLNLTSEEQWTRLRRVLNGTISVVPVIFSQGMNEMQTVANTVGKDLLQKEINAENLVVLEKYTQSFLEWQQTRGERHLALLDVVGTELRQLREAIERAGRGKHMTILTLSSSIARLVGGGRVTCCKSAKDRTSMSLTLEEATLLVRTHGLRASDRDAFTTLLRTHGVRRENARKNIGRAQYCFNAFQNFLLPTDYQCPPGTGGGGSGLA